MSFSFFISSINTSFPKRLIRDNADIAIFRIFVSLNYVKNVKFLEFKKIEDETFDFEVLQIGNLYGVAIIESRSDFADFFFVELFTLLDPRIVGSRNTLASSTAPRLPFFNANITETAVLQTRR